MVFNRKTIGATDTLKFIVSNIPYFDVHQACIIFFLSVHAISYGNRHKVISYENTKLN